MRKKLICRAYKILLPSTMSTEWSVHLTIQMATYTLWKVRLFKKHKVDFTECVHSLALLFQMPTQGKMVCWKAEIGKKIISYALENRKLFLFSYICHNLTIFLVEIRLCFVWSPKYHSWMGDRSWMFEYWTSSLRVFTDRAFIRPPLFSNRIG